MLLLSAKPGKNGRVLSLDKTLPKESFLQQQPGDKGGVPCFCVSKQVINYCFNIQVYSDGLVGGSGKH